jgi:glycine betaine/proline transport system substrate-binding protein
MLLLALTACRAGTPTTTPVNREVVEMETALPGEGQTLAVGLPVWDTGWFKNWVVFMLAEELGYAVSTPKVLENPAFYNTVAAGEVHFWASGWLPLHNAFLEPVADRVTVADTLVQSGALQGYLIDKPTAEKYQIANLEDFKDPEIAALFDTDGNGLANLIGCDPSGACEQVIGIISNLLQMNPDILTCNPNQGCGRVIRHHLTVYELQDAIEQDQGNYAKLMDQTIARYQAGEPIFFYTWTPNWTTSALVPGEDVVWLEVPFPDLPEAQAQFADNTLVADVAGCANDPCQMGFPSNDLTIIANREWLNENPALAQLFESVEISLVDIENQNARLRAGEDSQEEIRGHAEEWIAENRARVDEWLRAAIAAAE